MLLAKCLSLFVHVPVFLKMIENYPFEFFLSFHDSRASDFGLMKIDNKGRVLFFSEKPKGEDLKAMVMIFFFFHYYSFREMGSDLKALSGY